jgi:RNA polymerase sigma-70 factor (ECF subfamily)
MELLFDRIHKTASYLTANRQEAMDIAQSACIEVLRSVGEYRGDASITYWADRITLRTAASVARTKTRRQRIGDEFFQPGPSIMGVDEKAGRAQVQAQLTVLVQKLKPKLREIVLLRHIHDYSVNETAALCDIPIETARARLRKARSTLKKMVLSDSILKEWVREWIEE